MPKLLRDRLFGLVTDERGAAMAITLAVFMFIYLLFIGMWAVGMNVRTRIHLQNACDAAAYSAAVVQADTLSRLATINRAMSWTYTQMTRRQMDYIMYTWLRETCAHHAADSVAAAAFSSANARGGRLPITLVPPLGWQNSDITLASPRATHGSYSEGELRNIISTRFPSDMRSRSRSSFYAGAPTPEGLRRQIQADLASLDAMNQSARALIVGGNGQASLPTRIEQTARTIWHANLPARIRTRGAEPVVYQAQKPVTDYFTTLGNTARDEKRLVGFANPLYRRYFEAGGALDGSLIFDRGASTWFTRDSNRQSGGVRRAYQGGLSATWQWFATGWTSGVINGIPWMIPTSYAGPSICLHGLHDPVDCSCRRGSRTTSGTYNTNRSRFRLGKFLGLVSATGIIARWNNGVCRAGNNRSQDDLYRSRHQGRNISANPYLLTSAYFGKAGSILVGAACANENPWAPILGDTSAGIYSAFNPFCPQTIVFSAAKAGYRDYNAGLTAGRNYRVDWANERDWNLYTSDWDAVLIPVAKAATPANNGAWGTMVEFLATAVGALGGDTSFTAAGDWRIGTPGGSVNWNGVQRRMWH